ncbi:hypothetical protein [uncultured Methanobrevibacter sp.]|uniref:hypothetical protein n=1 Tax=uncultured Methanobrevibacter sp. TaxID=253161 RepID=UPI002606AAD7|nr:hypothetical protein [uncultured Methanobrevibacter sp.]
MSISIFADSLKHYLKEQNEVQKIFNSQTLEFDKLNSDIPFKSINYYYTIRSNGVHRGKNVSDVDEKRLRTELDLLNISQCVLYDT